VATPDDGAGTAEILVTVGVAPEELAPYRARAQVICAVGTPLAPYYAFGADEAVPPQEPEALFRRLRSVIERNDLVARIERIEQTAVRNAETTARARSVTIAAAPPDQAVEIRADDELLQRLLDNLIANAVRFTPAGGVVEVGAWRSSPRNVRLAVRDSGPGIAEGDLGKLVAGLGPGRGLRICREIAAKHGGDLWAESKVGQGTRFLVELPLAFPQSRPHVLVVSDDQTWVEGVARSLRQACDVRSSSLAEAK